MLYRLFSIGKHHPDTVPVALLAAKVVSYLKQDGSRRTAIVGTGKGRVTQEVRRVVMTGDDDDPLFGPGKLGDYVTAGKLPLRCVGGENVVFDRIRLQMCVDVVLELLVVGTANRPRSESRHFLGVLKGTRGVKGRQRAGVRGK